LAPFEKQLRPTIEQELERPPLSQQPRLFQAEQPFRE
jgi:hypothetical protein